MRSFSVWAFMCLMVALFSLSACKEEPPREESFLVNGGSVDVVFSPSADTQYLHITVFSERDWTLVPEGVQAPWVSFETVATSARNNWTVSFLLEENKGESPRRAVFRFVSRSLERKLTLVQQTEDPIFRQEELGAYGVPGGDVVLHDGWQYGILRYGVAQQNIRLFQPSQARVVSLSGLPYPLKAGMEVSALYRVMEQGFTYVCVPYSLQVIRVRENKVWLKEGDTTYFVLEEE